MASLETRLERKISCWYYAKGKRQLGVLAHGDRIFFEMRNAGLDFFTASDLNQTA